MNRKQLICIVILGVFPASAMAGVAFSAPELDGGTTGLALALVGALVVILRRALVK
jgi:hypothetical protein